MFHFSGRIRCISQLLVIVDIVESLPIHCGTVTAMGLVKLDIALSRKKPIESRIDLRRFPGMEHPLLDLFQPQVTRFVSFNPLRTEGFFFGMGGGGWTFLSRKIAGLHFFFAARLQAGVESLARRF